MSLGKEMIEMKEKRKKGNRNEIKLKGSDYGEDVRTIGSLLLGSTAWRLGKGLVSL